jgi:hypothetical protein
MASIEDAVSFAEHLRNVEGVTDFSVYALTPVSLKLRAYYHVEISEAARTAVRQAPLDPGPVDPVAAIDTAPPADTAPVEASPVESTPVDSAEVTQLPETPPALPEPAPAAFDRYAIPAEAARPDDTAPAEPAAADVAGQTEPPTIPEMPFVAGPTATRLTSVDAFVKDEPIEAAGPEIPHPIDRPVIDPSVVDPTVEEVVPVPPGRRSMGFFARS